MFLFKFILNKVQDINFINISIYSGANGFQLRMTLLCEGQDTGTSHLGEFIVEQPRQKKDLDKRG